MPKSSVDADAQAFLTAAAITDPTISAAINTLVVQMKADNIWSKMKAVYPMVGGTANSHKFNLKDPRDLDAAFRLVFSGGITHNSNGMQGNGVNGFANSKLIPFSNLIANSTHLSYYSRTNVNAQQVEIGSLGNNNVERLVMELSFEGTFDSDQYIFTTGRVSAANANSTGFYLGTRTNSNTHKAFKNGTQLGSTNTGAAGNFSQVIRELEILRFNNQYYSTKQCAFASIGDGLTDTEAANLYTAVQTFQTTLGRSVGTQTVSDSDAQAFVTNAAIVDQVQATAVNNLVVGMKADGIWSKMKAVYPFVGGSASAHKFNLKDPRDLDAAFRLQFNGGWTHSANGALPNGTNGWANTFFNPSTNLVFDNLSFGLYSRTQDVSGTKIYGVRDNTLFRDMYHNVSSKFFSTDGNAAILSYTLTPTTGLINFSRTSNISGKIYSNGVLIATKSTPVVSLMSNANFFLGARSDSNSPNWYNNYQIGLQYISEGLTDTEAANLYTRVQAFQTALSRQV